METTVFIIKKESLKDFIKTKALDNKKHLDGGFNDFYFFQDSILLKKSADLPIDGIIKFEIERDLSEAQKLILIYHYTYKIVPYDSLSIELVLQDFSVDTNVSTKRAYNTSH